MIIKKNSTSKLIRFRILDSSLTTGAGKTGLDTHIASINCYYIREGAAAGIPVTLTTGSYGTWASGSFAVLSNASMPGIYELGIPNKALSAGADSVVVYMRGVTNMKQTAKEIELWAVNPQDTSLFGLTKIATAGDLSVTINTTE